MKPETGSFISAFGSRASISGMFITPLCRSQAAAMSVLLPRPIDFSTSPPIRT